jgi:hypothetical protein
MAGNINVTWLDTVLPEMVLSSYLHIKTKNKTGSERVDFSVK